MQDANGERQAPPAGRFAFCILHFELRMFILDSLMIAGIRWALETTLAAAEAEMNDDSVLREQLLEAEMRREMGEISDQEFQDIEADLLARIREIKERREGGGPLGFGAQPMETTGDSTFQVEASVSGDFYEPADAPHTTVIESSPTRVEEVRVLDMEPGDAAPPVPAPRARRAAGAPPARRARSAARPKPPARTSRASRTGRRKP
jgi:hypothetical protein